VSAEPLPGPPRRHPRRVGTWLAAALVGLSALALPAHAEPAVERAEIVFANGGRIVSIAADGSGRRVLTRRHGRVVAPYSWDQKVPVADSMPSISPDGDKLLFKRDFDLGPVSWRSEVIVADRDGTGQEVVLSFGNSPGISWLGWSPDGRIVVGRWRYEIDKKGEVDRYRVDSYDDRGGGHRTLIARSYRGSGYLVPTDFSPDGRAMLYATEGAGGPALRERDLGTGRDRLVLGGADYGAYSPDGSSLAVVAGSCRSARGLGPCRGWEPGLWTVRPSDGKRRRLVGGAGGIGRPDWSADGRRIVFTSSRNFPRSTWDRASSEVYSVGVAGGCLAWLTNGSPGSVDAAWGPEPLGSGPGGCGANGLEPLVEVGPEKGKRSPSPRLWAGPAIQGRLLSSVGRYAGSESFVYADCAYFERARCRESLTLDSFPACNPRNLASGIRVDGRRAVPRRLRGVTLLVQRRRNGEVAARLRTGRADVFLGDSMFAATDGIPNTVGDLERVVALLRPVGKQLDTSRRLPRPRRAPCGGR